VVRRHFSAVRKCTLRIGVNLQQACNCAVLFLNCSVAINLICGYDYTALVQPRCSLIPARECN